MCPLLPLLLNPSLTASGVFDWVGAGKKKKKKVLFRDYVKR